MGIDEVNRSQQLKISSHFSIACYRGAGEAILGSIVKIAIGCDHAGYDLKAILIEELERNYPLDDIGVHDKKSMDYPVIVLPLVQKMRQDPALKGILICGTGIGMCMAANRFPEIRAVVGTNGLDVSLSRRHNNANILCLGGRMIGIDMALVCVQTFLQTSFEGGRHTRRLDLLESLV